MVRKIPLWFTEYHSDGTGITIKIKRVLETRFSKYQRIDVVETEDWGRMLILDGCIMLTERDEFIYHEMLVHPAMVMHPEPKAILVVGGGDGGTMREILKYPMVERAVLAELDRDVIDVSRKYLKGLSESLNDKRVDITIGDAFSYLGHTDSSFDIVFVDSTDPVGPAEVLITEEFYKRVKEHLKEGGFLAVQAESPFFHMETIKTIKERLGKFFKFVKFYLAPVPTYPGGYWAFAISSDDEFGDPRRKPPSGLKFYNEDIHGALFKLPQFLKNEGI